MKKLFISLMLLSGIYGLSFAQQGSQGSQGSQRQSTGAQQSTGTQQTQQGSTHQGTQGMGSQQQGSSSQSKDADWVKIGEKTVDLSADKGIFDWNTDREKSVNANEMYSAIKFRAKDAPVTLSDVEVEYDNGKKQQLTVGVPIQKNTDSKVLTLNSRDKLDKITFNFKKDETASKEKANIEVWGLKAGSSSGMGQSNNPDQKK